MRASRTSSQWSAQRRCWTSVRASSCRASATPCSWGIRFRAPSSTRSGWSSTTSASRRWGPQPLRRRRRRSSCCCRRTPTMQRCCSPRRRTAPPSTSPRVGRWCSSLARAWTWRSFATSRSGACSRRSDITASCRWLAPLASASGPSCAWRRTTCGSGTGFRMASTTCTWTTSSGWWPWTGPFAGSSSRVPTARGTRPRTTPSSR
mmetsp:Transcript_79951/g.205659  ORF Transcript_79951/g.205659 Transcript_79951/m.205659 type:complete len:205 (-) Transcript_79951:1617-2231(-)